MNKPVPHHADKLADMGMALDFPPPLRRQPCPVTAMHAAECDIERVCGEKVHEAVCSPPQCFAVEVEARADAPESFEGSIHPVRLLLKTETVRQCIRGRRSFRVI